MEHFFLSEDQRNSMQAISKMAEERRNCSRKIEVSMHEEFDRM
jgi:hypothetical protein